MKARNLHIDTLRGIACIFLVSYHVVGMNADVGLRIDSGLYRELNDILAYIRMPLFTFLSGIVYAYRPFSTGVGNFIKGKLRRLIIPMLVVGTAFALLQSIIPGTNDSVENWWLLHIEPVAHFWFIESIFIIFMLVIPLEIFKAFDSPGRFIGIFVLASALYLSDLRLHYFSVSGAIYLFPYFLLGMALQRFSILQSLNLKIAFLLLGSTALLLTLLITDVFGSTPKRSVLGLIIGTMACVGLLSLKLKSTVLARIGLFSYSIYLFHVFFTAGSRIILGKFGIQDINLLFAISLMMGIIGPIATEIICNGTNFTRIALLGKSKTNISALWLTKKFSTAI